MINKGPAVQHSAASRGRSLLKRTTADSPTAATGRAALQSELHRRRRPLRFDTQLFRYSASSNSFNTTLISVSNHY